MYLYHDNMAVFCEDEKRESKFTYSSHYFPEKIDWVIVYLTKNKYWGVVIY